MFAPLRLSVVVSAVLLCWLVAHHGWAQCNCGEQTGLAGGQDGTALSPIACDDGCAGLGDGVSDCAGCGQGIGDCAGCRPGAGGKRAGCRRCGGTCKKCAGYPSDGSYCGLPEPRYPVPFATPRPTVPTHFTYPPMMPHNSLPHFRSTYAFRHGPGLSQTQVHWRERKLLLTADFIHHLFEIPR